MIINTTPSVEGRRIVAYHGVVSGEAILGANVFRDFFASIRDVVGGRSGSYEKVLRSAIANAQQKDGFGGDVERLFVNACYADQGPSQKRVRPAPMGRAFRVVKRTAHLTVEVTERAAAARTGTGPRRPRGAKPRAAKAGGSRAPRKQGARAAANS